MLISYVLKCPDIHTYKNIAMAEKKTTKGGSLNFMFIFGMILAILVIIFAIQNSHDTIVRFFRAEATVPTALLIFVSILVGGVMTLLFSVPGRIKARKEHARIKTELKDLSKKYDELAAVQPSGSRNN